MIVKTEGIILRVLPYSRTSLMADCLTRDNGRIWLLAKGAYRSKSPMLGQLDLFYTCEVLFYLKSSRVMVLKECSPLEIRGNLRKDWRATTCASYFCDFMSQVTPPGVAHEDLFVLLSQSLDLLAKKSATAGLMGWFELTALKLLGLGPSLSHCVICGKDPLINAGTKHKISSRQGGVLCPGCESRESSGFITVSTGTLALLRNWVELKDPQKAALIVPSGTQWQEIQIILKDFSAYHLDLPLRSRNLTLEWLNSLPRSR